MKITITVDHEGEQCTDEMAKKAIRQLDLAVADIMLDEFSKPGKTLINHGPQFTTVIMEVKP